MSEGLLLAILVGVIVIVLVSVLSRRLGVPGPLILVVVGVGISLLPQVSAVSVAPELILAGVLPPLLYSAAVNAPAIEFRRDLTAISGLAVLLVLISAFVLGLFFFWVIPGIGFPMAVALGAILSPTDAVATTIVKKVGAPRRVVAILEGESLLNDASALVILRTAIVAAASGFSFIASVGSFAWSVVIALAVGAVVGTLALRLRVWTGSATANTALGLTVPYLAYLPSEALGGSGLVAAVAAGVVCGQGSLRRLTPEQRISDKLNWRTIEFLLEGAVFLIMGLELYGIVEANLEADQGLLIGGMVAAGAFLILLLVRAAYVFPVLRFQARRARRAVHQRIVGGEEALREEAREAAREAEPAPPRGGIFGPRRRGEDATHMGQLRADKEYYTETPLTWRHDALIVWAGMRGAVTLAAAQTLPQETPQRDLLVFIAFLVAATSLLLQGTTLPLLARIVGLRKEGANDLPRDEIRKIVAGLRDEAQVAIDSQSVLRPNRTRFPDEIYARSHTQFMSPLDLKEEHRTPDSLEFELAIIAVMREHLHVLGRSGWYSTSALRFVLDELDAYEISVKLHLEREG